MLNDSRPLPLTKGETTMSVFELEPIPLSKILEQVRELMSKGYDPLHFLAQFLFADNGGRLRKA